MVLLSALHLCVADEAYTIDRAFRWFRLVESFKKMEIAGSHVRPNETTAPLIRQEISKRSKETNKTVPDNVVAQLPCGVSPIDMPDRITFRSLFRNWGMRSRLTRLWEYWL